MLPGLKRKEVGPMDEVRLLSQDKILQEWWQEVKENFWEHDGKPQVLKLVKELMESTVKEDLELYTGQQYQEQIERYKLYRNGYYRRSLITQFGYINDLRIPRLRKGGFKTRVFRRYRRYENIVEDLIMDIFLAGVSTRRVGAAIAKLLDTKVSHSRVSNITRRLDVKVREYQKKEFIDEYQYLFLDGITLKVRYNTKYHNRKVLVAYGITIFGKRELLSFRQARSESYEEWVAFIDDLYRRGLKGDNLRLIISDGSKGLLAALDMVYPLISRQACWVHKLRNVSKYLPKKYENQCQQQLSCVYNAKSKSEALSQFKEWRKTWVRVCPKAVECVEKDIDNLLNFYDCPRRHWKKIYTTNVIERQFKEVRRRTNVFSCFSNIASCNRIIYAIFAHLNNNWKERPLKDFTQFA
jgi:transposase-like protein